MQDNKNEKLLAGLAGAGTIGSILRYKGNLEGADFRADSVFKAPKGVEIQLKDAKKLGAKHGVSVRSNNIRDYVGIFKDVVKSDALAKAGVPLGSRTIVSVPVAGMMVANLKGMSKDNASYSSNFNMVMMPSNTKTLDGATLSHEIGHSINHNKKNIPSKIRAASTIAGDKAYFGVLDRASGVLGERNAGKLARLTDNVISSPGIWVEEAAAHINGPLAKKILLSPKSVVRMGGALGTYGAVAGMSLAATRAASQLLTKGKVVSPSAKETALESTLTLASALAGLKLIRKGRKGLGTAMMGVAAATPILITPSTFSNRRKLGYSNKESAALAATKLLGSIGGGTAGGMVTEKALRTSIDTKKKLLS